MDVSRLEKVVELTGFVIIHVFIASFSPAQGERNQMVNAKFTRPVNAMPMSTLNQSSANPGSFAATGGGGWAQTKAEWAEQPILL